MLTLFICTVLSISDGDTFKCRELDTATAKPIVVRLSGVNSREMRGNPCPKKRPCPAMSAVSSKRVLDGMIRGKVLRCESVGRSWARISAWCSAPGVGDVSCLMLRAKAAAYWPAYDKAGRLRGC